MKKFYVLLGIAIMAIGNMYAQTNVKMYAWESGNQAAFLATSPNGEYACGYGNGYAVYYSAADNWNIYLGASEDGGTGYVLAAVNDEGIGVGSYSLGGDVSATIPAYYKDGEWIKLPLPSGHTLGGAMDISNDGTIVGWAQKGMYYSPCVWKDGEVKILKYPAVDPYGKTEVDAVIEHISADGKIITGHYILSTGRFVPAIWRNMDEECELLHLEVMFHLDKPVPGEEPLASDYITVDVLDPEYYEQQQAYERAWLAYKEKVAEFETGDRLDGRHMISPNGKYMCTYMLKKDGNNVPVWMDLEEGSIKFLETISDGIALSVSNDGNMTVGGPTVSAIRDGYIYLNKADKLVAMEEWLQDEFDFDMIHGENGIASISEFDMSASWIMNQDGSRMYGFIGGMPFPTYNYRIDLPESLDVNKIDQTVMTDQRIVYVNGTLQFTQKADQATVYNLAGTAVYSADNVGTTSVQVDLPQGVYIVKMMSDGISYSDKIMVK